MNDKYAIELDICPDPLSLVFTNPDGNSMPVPLPVSAALTLVINVLSAPQVMQAIRLPGFAKRSLMWVLLRDWRRARLAEFK